MEMMESDENETDKINVVPLADLSLVLLIIMMLLAPAAISSMIRVETPKVEKVKASRQKKDLSKTSEPLFIKVAASGITLNNNKVDSIEFLAEQIAIKLSEDPERPVIVAADENIQVGEVVNVLDVAKQSGANKISLLKGAKES